MFGSTINNLTTKPNDACSQGKSGQLPNNNPTDLISSMTVVDIRSSKSEDNMLCKYSVTCSTTTVILATF